MFYQIEDYRGVDTKAPTPSIMVPRWDCNLIVHDFEASKLAWDAGIKVQDLTDELKQNVGAALQSLIQLVRGPLDDLEATAGLLRKAIPMLHDKRNRLVAIASDLADDYELWIEGRKRLDVAVRGAASYPLSFVYYKYTGTEKQDEWGALGGPLNSDWHSNSAIDLLNRFFVPQANIEFTRHSVRDWETADYHPSWHVRDGQFGQFNDIDLTKFAHSEGITVFVVPEIGDIDANSFSDDATNIPGLKGHVTWVPRHIQPEKLKILANPKDDPFIALLAHELVHDLVKDPMFRAAHSDRAYVMCNSHANSKIDEEYLIDKVTLDRINPKK